MCPRLVVNRLSLPNGVGPAAIHLRGIFATEGATTDRAVGPETVDHDISTTQAGVGGRSTQRPFACGID